MVNVPTSLPRHLEFPVKVHDDDDLVTSIRRRKLAQVVCVLAQLGGPLDDPASWQAAERTSPQRDVSILAGIGSLAS